MKSDVIRKRSRHEIRRAGLAGSCSETPSASPGASRRASPARAPTPQPPAEEEPRQEEQQKTPQFSYDYTSSNVGQASKNSPPNDMLSSVSTRDQNDSSGETNVATFSRFPGPYHPDYLYQYTSGSDLHPIQTSFNGESSEYGVEDRGSKRRRLSSSSYESSTTATEPPPSASSLRSGSGSGSHTNTTSNNNTNNATDNDNKIKDKSPTSSPPFSSYGLPYSVYTYQGFDASSSWMTGGDSSSSTQKIHPPMVLPDDAPMEYLHPPMSLSNESSSSSSQPSSFLHPPMLPADFLPRGNSPIVGYSHPPMLPSYWSSSDSSYPYNDQQSNNSNDNSHMDMFDAMMNPME